MLIDWYLVRLPSEILHPAKRRKQIHIPTAKQHWEIRKCCGTGGGGVWGETRGDKGGETVVWMLKNNNNKVIIDMKKEKEKDSSVLLQMTCKRNSDP